MKVSRSFWDDSRRMVQTGCSSLGPRCLCRDCQSRDRVVLVLVVLADHRLATDLLELVHRVASSTTPQGAAMTPLQHFDRAHWWGDLFDWLHSWVEPAKYVAFGLLVWTWGCIFLGSKRDAVIALFVQTCWLFLQVLHKLAGRFCVWRLKVHGEAFIKTRCEPCSFE